MVFGKKKSDGQIFPKYTVLHFLPNLSRWFALPLSVIVQKRQSFACLLEILFVLLNDTTIDEIIWTKPFIYAIMCSIDYSFIPMIIPLVRLSNNRRMTILFASLAVSLIFVANSAIFKWENVLSHLKYWFMGRDLTPNIGIQWYFGQECFPEYRTLSNIVLFKIIPIVSIILICKHLKKSPELVWISSFGICVSAFNAFPSIWYHLVMLKALFSLRNQLAEFQPRVFLVPYVMIVTMLLSGIFWHNWVQIGNMNVNFVYFSLLVYNVAFMVGICDTIRAIRKELTMASRANPIVELNENYNTEIKLNQTNESILNQKPDYKPKSD